MVADKKNLSERLKRVGLNRADFSEKGDSIDLLSTFYLSTTQKRDHQIQKNNIQPKSQEKDHTERIAQRAVKILGEAIGKKR
jgi:hypothetical protein